MAKRETIIVIASLMLGTASAPIVTSAIERESQAATTAAQVRQDINNGRYTQAEYDCDFDDCSDDEIYIASKQAAVAKHANQFLAQIKEFYHGTGY